MDKFHKVKYFLCDTAHSESYSMIITGHFDLLNETISG